jgi:hypothetical protein
MARAWIRSIDPQLYNVRVGEEGSVGGAEGGQ